MTISDVKNIINIALADNVKITRSKKTIEDIVNSIDYNRSYTSHYHPLAHSINIGGDTKDLKLSPIKTLLHEIGHSQTVPEKFYKYWGSKSGHILAEHDANTWVLSKLPEKSKPAFRDHAKKQVNSLYKFKFITSNLNKNTSIYKNLVTKLDPKSVDDYENLYRALKHDKNTRKEISSIARKNQEILKIPAFDKTAAVVYRNGAYFVIGPEGGVKRGPYKTFAEAKSKDIKI